MYAKSCSSEAFFKPIHNSLYYTTDQTQELGVPKIKLTKFDANIFFR